MTSRVNSIPPDELALTIITVAEQCTGRLSGIRRAHLQPENVPLALKKVEGGVEVTVPKVTLHSLVVFSEKKE